MAVEFTDQDEQAVANALCVVAHAINNLGNGDAATRMGGLEALGAVLKEGLEGVAGANDGISTSLDRIADAIERHGRAVDRLAEAMAR